MRNSCRSCTELLHRSNNCNIAVWVARMSDYIDKNATVNYNDITKQRKPPTSKGGTEHEDKYSERNGI